MILSVADVPSVFLEIGMLFPLFKLVSLFWFKALVKDREGDTMRIIILLLKKNLRQKLGRELWLQPTH